MEKKKVFRYKILFVWIIVLLFGISAASSIGNMTEYVTNYSNDILSINNEVMISSDQIAYLIGQSSYCGAWDFILNKPIDLTCICEGELGSGDFLTGGAWTKDGVIVTSEYNSGLLYGINLETCEMWSIGGGGTDIIALAYDPVTCSLYGSSDNNYLYKIDPDTGEQEQIGPFGGGVLYMVGMAFDSEGILYGWDLGTDSVWIIDTDTGEATLIGSLGINITYGCDGDFCIDDDTLYIPIPDGQPSNTFTLYASDGSFYYGQFPYDVYLNFLVIPWNYPPYTPSNPIPFDGATNVSGCSVRWNGGDPDGDFVYYDVYFGNTTPPPKVISNVTVNHFISGECELNTTYYWKIVSRDEHNAIREGPIWSFTTIGNNSPLAPIITGPTNGRTQVLYDYYFLIYDPEEDDMFIHIDWENGTPSKWYGPYPSGSIIIYNHSWKNKGKYTIRAQTQDINGLLSDWGTLEVIIPKNKASYSQLILWFLGRFPLLERFLSFLYCDLMQRFGVF